jgi:mycothiol synthase
MTDPIPHDLTSKDEPMNTLAPMSAPAGVTLRPYAGEPDIEHFVRISSAGNAADGVDERASHEMLLNWFSHARPSYDPEKDVVVADFDGIPVAYGFTSWVDTTDGLRDYMTRGHVHPDWRRRGVGSAILAHNEARLREVAASHETERPRFYLAFSPDSRLGAVALLAGAGYHPVRYFFDMLRPTLDDVEVPPMPEGLELRPVSGREQLRQLFDADADAFQDHWGGFDSSDELFEQWLADPDMDPTLHVVAYDGDEIAGAVMNEINVHENRELNRQRGLLDSVFVRRAWRGRGLAAALVARSLILLRDRGMTSAWLGVDAANPSGALRLYEKAGFAVHTRSAAYRKPMELDR